MPFYEYHCLDCKKIFNVFHSMDKEYDGTCGFCESVNVEKVVSTIGNKVDKGRFKAKTGDVVKQHIEEAKQEVKKQKQDLKKKEMK